MLDDTLFISVERGRIDFKPKPAGDSAVLDGTLASAQGTSSSCGEEVIFSLDGTVFSQVVPGSQFVQNGKKASCVYRQRGRPDGVTVIELNLTTGKWKVELSGINLDALTNPVEVALSIGDDEGSESLLMHESRTRTTGRIVGSGYVVAAMKERADSAQLVDHGSTSHLSKRAKFE